MVFISPWKRKDLSQIWTWPHIFWIEALGWWEEESSSFPKKQLLYVWRIINIFHAAGFTISLLIAIIMTFTVRDVNLLAIFTLEPAFIGVCKAINLIKYRKSIKTAMSLLDELTKDMSGKENITFYRSEMKKVWIVYFISIFGIVAVLLHWSLRPIMMAILYGEKSRILDTWPIFIDSWTEFIFSYVYQISNLCLVCFGIMLFDSLYFCMSECILCHLAILKGNLEQFHFTSETENKHLKTIMKSHIQILQSIKELKSSTEAVLIIQNLMAVLTFCVGVFIITMSEDVNLNLIMNLSESVSALSLLLFFTYWYSNEITLQCDNLRTAAYMSQWMDGSVYQKKSLLILMTRSMLPNKFGGFLEIDLNTFLNVLKTTFSYYNFLLVATGTRTIGHSN